VRHVEYDHRRLSYCSRRAIEIGDARIFRNREYGLLLLFDVLGDERVVLLPIMNPYGNASEYVDRRRIVETNWVIIDVTNRSNVGT